MEFMAGASSAPAAGQRGRRLPDLLEHHGALKAQSA